MFSDKLHRVTGQPAHTDASGKRPLRFATTLAVRPFHPSRRFFLSCGRQRQFLRVHPPPSFATNLAHTIHAPAQVPQQASKLMTHGGWQNRQRLAALRAPLQASSRSMFHRRCFSWIPARSSSLSNTAGLPHSSTTLPASTPRLPAPTTLPASTPRSPERRGGWPGPPPAPVLAGQASHPGVAAVASAGFAVAYGTAAQGAATR
eukprot:365641-Chlamydomonas_euryale.AAC.8